VPSELAEPHLERGRRKEETILENKIQFQTSDLLSYKKNIAF